jgi:hypothetical protein
MSSSLSRGLWRRASTMLRSAMRPPRRFSLRWLFVAYGILVAIPFLVLLGLFFLRASALEREVFEQRLTLRMTSIGTSSDG